MSKYKRDKDSNLLNQLCRNSNLNSYQLEKLLDNAEARSRNLLQKHPLTTAQFKKIITHFNEGNAITLSCFNGSERIKNVSIKD